MIAPLWWCWDGALRRGKWGHPVRANANNSVRIAGGSGRISVSASMPRLIIDGDTTFEADSDNERIEVDG